MSRRNQARRRRSYGRRQHDLRQRRRDVNPDRTDRELDASPDRRYGELLHLHLPEARQQEEAA